MIYKTIKDSHFKKTVFFNDQNNEVIKRQNLYIFVLYSLSLDELFILFQQLYYSGLLGKLLISNKQKQKEFV
jgi:hypothetical protein